MSDSRKRFLITFVCSAPDHGRTTPERDSHLTIHESKWAVCPAGFKDGHTWLETEGVRYEQMFVTRALRERAS